MNSQTLLVNTIQTHTQKKKKKKKSKERCLLGQDKTNKFSGESLLLNYITLKNDEKLNHLFVFGWAMLFACPVLGRMINIFDRDLQRDYCIPMCQLDCMNGFHRFLVSVDVYCTKHPYVSVSMATLNR